MRSYQGHSLPTTPTIGHKETGLLDEITPIIKFMPFPVINAVSNYSNKIYEILLDLLDIGVKIRFLKTAQLQKR